MKTRIAEIEPATTKDGSMIRELMHPDKHAVQHQSLAEATIAPGITTALHIHQNTEELYHILAGQGRMTLGDTHYLVSPGDTICITPGVAHCLENTGTEPLRLLCCCAPAYSHEDTGLI